MPERTPEKKQEAPAQKANPTYDDGEDNTEPAPKQRRMMDKTSARTISAKFDAPCKECGKLIRVGTQMTWISEGVDKGAYHVACAA